MEHDVEEIHDPADVRVADYRDIRDADVRGRAGAFVAEGRTIVRALVAGATRYRARSVLVNEATCRALADDLARLPADVPVYVGKRDVLAAIVGFDIHRGCLAIGEAGDALGPAELVDEVRARGPIVVLEDLTNADNVGAVFRNAVAFAAAGVMLTERCVDPLYRKAIRVSMGATLRVPFSRAGRAVDSIASLEDAGYTCIGLSPRTDALDAAELDRYAQPGARVAIVLGTEGPGLSDEAARRCAATVRIAMAPGVDSLNVATATGIALHRLMPVPAGPGA